MANKRGNNEGSIHRIPSGNYRAMVTIQGGRLSKVFATRQEARDYLLQMLEQVDQGLTYASSQLTLEQYLKEWIVGVQPSLRPRTGFQYEQMITQHIIPRLGSIKLKDLRPEHVEWFYQARQKAGKGVRTIRYVHSVLHRALAQAVRRGILSRNPADGVNLPRKVQGEMQIWEEAEVTRFLVVIQGDRNEALFHLVIKTGMRQGELRGLRWADLDWTRGILHVQRQVQRVSQGGFQYLEPKTRAGRRSLQLGEATLQVLREHKERLETVREFAGERWREEGLMFPSTIGTPQDQRNFQRFFDALIKKAGLQKIRFHDLRHTAASVMLNHGVPVIVVSRILGHSRPSITLDIYGHLIHDMQGEAARIMDEALTPVKVDLSAKKNQTAGEGALSCLKDNETVGAKQGDFSKILRLNLEDSETGLLFSQR